MNCDLGDDQPMGSEKPEADLKAEIMAAMAEHLHVYGPRNWKLLRERPEFASIIGEQAGEAGRRKFYRWLRLVREPMPADKTRPHEGRAAAEDALANARERAQTVVQRHLPAAPSPAFFLKMGADAEVKVGLVAAFDEVWGDLQLVRSHSFEDDGAGGHRLKSAKTLQESAKSRMAVVESAVRLMREIYDFAGLRRMYQAVVDIIVSEVAEAPQIQARVLDRLQELNNTQAMTPFAESP